jgi:hypothetical protein
MDEYGVSQKIDNFHSAVEQKMIALQKKLTGADAAEVSEEKGASAQDRKYFVHVTQWPSETLACVAKWYTGDTTNRRTLAEANPDIDPAKIAVGTSILIPEKMIRNHEDLPKEFAGRFGRDYFKHTVRWPGESLSLIARWYTGSSKNWRALARANPNLNPNRIKFGNCIFIPPDALVTRDPLPQKVAAKYTPSYFAHTVQGSSEKLVDVAHWYTGSPENWEALAVANPQIDPENLAVGAEIFIPAKLLITREPIPDDSYTRASQEQQKKIAPSRATAPQKQDKAIRLFGPKQFPKG